MRRAERKRFLVPLMAMSLTFLPGCRLIQALLGGALGGQGGIPGLSGGGLPGGLGGGGLPGGLGGGSIPGLGTTTGVPGSPLTSAPPGLPGSNQPGFLTPTGVGPTTPGATAGTGLPGTDQGAAGNPVPTAVSWGTNLASGKTQAASGNKKIWFRISATWCGPCKTMAQTAFPDPAVIAASAAFVPVVLESSSQNLTPEVDAQVKAAFPSQSAAGIGFSGTVPYMVILNPDGTVKAKQTGAMQAAQLAAWLNANR